jgi:hypothetical protein
MQVVAEVVHIKQLQQVLAEQVVAVLVPIKVIQELQELLTQEVNSNYNDRIRIGNWACYQFSYGC